MHFACYFEICLGDGVKEPNHGNSAPLLPEVQHWWNHRCRFLLQRKTNRIAWMQVPLSGVAALSGAMRWPLPGNLPGYPWNEVICCRGCMTLEKTKRVCCNYLRYYKLCTIPCDTLIDFAYFYICRSWLQAAGIAQAACEWGPRKSGGAANCLPHGLFF